MKKLLSIFLFAFALVAQAQPLPQNQCPQAGVLLARDYVGLTGDTVQNSYNRVGESQIPTAQEFAGNLTARTYKVFNERYCVGKVHNYQQQVCVDIPADIAMGRGNNLFRSFFDLNISLLKRAEMFSQQVRYAIGTAQASRMATANEAVKNMTRLAISMGIPKSWEQFGLMLNKIVEEGLMTQAEYHEIFIANAVANRASLGFKPMDGVQMNEGRGNGKLGRLFDLNLTLQHRGALIRRTLEGVTDAASLNLAKSFIEFASVNGVPTTWNQLVLTLKDSVVKNAISQAEFINITETFEAANRAALGFEVNFVACKMENRQHPYNAIEEARKREFHQDVNKSFRLSITNAPLLAGENETFTVSFNGLDPIVASPTQNYNDYTIEHSSNGQIDLIKLVGMRKRVTPPNSIIAQVLHQGNKVNVNLQNSAFNPLIGGKVTVNVHFYEKVAIISDKKIGEHTFELKDGNMTPFTPNVKMIKASRKAYVQLYMKIEGSPYYNESLSEFKQFNE